MRLPDFLIIGAAKAGTTSLYGLLSRHPAIFMSTPKEPEFFARDDRFSAGIESYAALFDKARPDQICGEASTIYSLAPLFPETAARIQAQMPAVKLVYVLREPVARAYSYYVQLAKNYQNASQDYRVHRRFEEWLYPERFPGRAPREKALAGFDAHLPDVPELILAGSDYLLQARQYLAHFDRAQILFVSFEEFLADRAAVLDRLCAFLGIDPTGFGTGAAGAGGGDGGRANISQDHFDTVAQTLAIGAAKRRLGPLAVLARLLPAGPRRALRDLVVGARARPAGGDHLPPPMEPETRALLARRFAADRAELEALTGLSLAAWGQE